MKRQQLTTRLRVSLFGIALAAILAFGVACGGDGSSTDTNPPIDATAVLPTLPATNGIPQSNDDFASGVQAQIGKIEMRIADLEDEASNLSGSSQQDANQRIDDLKTEVSDLQGRLSDLTTANGDDSEQLKSEIESKLNDAESKVESLADELGI